MRFNKPDKDKAIQKMTDSISMADSITATIACYYKGSAEQGAGAVIIRNTFGWNYNPFQGWHRREIMEYEPLERLQRFKNTRVKVIGDEKVEAESLLEIINKFGERRPISADIMYKFWPFGKWLLIIVWPQSDPNKESLARIFNILVDI